MNRTRTSRRTDFGRRLPNGGNPVETWLSNYVRENQAFIAAAILDEAVAKWVNLSANPTR